MEEFEIGRFNLDYDEIIKDSVKLKESIDEIRKSQAQARKEGET